MREDRIVSETFGDEHVLTPSDLYNHEFRKSTVGGYKADEVDEFIERVADVMESLIEQVRALKQENAQQDERLEEYRQMEQTLRSALVSSQEFSQNVLESARQEAKAIVEEARAARAAADLQVTRVAEELTQEVRQLKEQRDRLKQDLLSVLAVHRSLIEDMGSRADDLLVAIAGPVSTVDEDTQFPETELDEVAEETEPAGGPSAEDPPLATPDPFGALPDAGELGAPAAEEAWTPPGEDDAAGSVSEPAAGDVPAHGDPEDEENARPRSSEAG